MIWSTPPAPIVVTHALQDYEKQSLLHPALADTQGASVCVVIPGKVLSAEQLTKMLQSRPLGGSAAEGTGRPQLGNSVTGLFALTDCLQVDGWLFSPVVRRPRTAYILLKIWQ